jgi:hypothetical protein
MPNYSNSVTRTLNDKLGETPSALDFGATGDNATDDTAAVQAAINATAARGVPLRLPAGTYLCTALTLPSNCTIIGEVGATIKQKASSGVINTPFITNATHGGGGNSEIYLAGVIIDGNTANQTATGVDLISLVNVDWFGATDCSFVNAVSECIWGHTLTHIEITRCYFDNWGVGNVGAINFDAWNGGGAVQDVRIEGSFFDGRTSNSTCVKIAGSLANKASDVIVTGNRCYLGASGASDVLGIELYSHYDQRGGYENFAITGNLVIGSDVSTTHCYGISAGGEGGYYGTIADNVVRDCRAVGIEGISSYITITGNTLTNCGAIGVVAGSANVEGVVISNNTIRNSRVQAIHIYAQDQDGSGPYSVYGCTVSGNVITMGDSCIGVWVQNNGTGTVSDIVVDGNVIKGTGVSNYGIAISQDAGTVTRITASNNLISTVNVGINTSGTNIRFHFNRFTSVTTNYGGTVGATDSVIDYDAGTVDLSAPSLKVRAMNNPTLDAAGNIVLPSDTARFTNSVSGAAYPNVWSFAPVNFGEEHQGGMLSVNSKFTGFPNWAQSSASAYARAMWVVLGAARFGIRFGAAANAGGSDPGTSAFYVDDGLGVYVGAGYPLYLYGTAVQLRAGTGVPAHTPSVGSLYMQSDPAAGESGMWEYRSTGWVQAVGGDITGDTLTLDDDHPYLRLKKSTVLKFEVDEDGNISAITAITKPVISKSDTGALEVQLADGTPKFKADAAGDITLCRDATLSRDLTMSALTASLPLKLTSGKKLTAAKIDLGTSADVAASGISTGQVISWGATACIGLAIGTASGQVAAGDHNHTGVYATAGHDHAGTYAPTSIVTGATITLAKLTPGGSNGSLTFNDNGQITGYTAPT